MCQKKIKSAPDGGGKKLEEGDIEVRKRHIEICTYLNATRPVNFKAIGEEVL